ncbi:DUF2510 domain-containing protein [Streptomyces zingiberis]|uniref:DUF2510 domain-containing protein n=1 Tax=Streptomyces zingiberis TaxID=2053010 RepID=A0ABX1BYP2_9ACTN|nr:DUF2510 domain-containing protein [Streptomyces zingiberis]NJQ01428.1 DUF2510 domain-containing protein [Streptomyces zingiberis]
MTTPPGWYPDPGQPGDGPASERWWDGSGWTDHTREAEAGGTFPPSGGFGPPPGPPAYGFRAEQARPGGSRSTRIAVLVAAAVVLVAAIAGGIVLLGSGDGGGTAAPAPTRPVPPSLPGEGGSGGQDGGPYGEPPGEPPGTGGRALDALNGISLPVPEGWEGRSGSEGAGLTTGPYPCPGDEELNCVRGGVSSLAAEGYEAETAKGVAEEDIPLNAEASYGKSPRTGDDAYGGIASHEEVRSEPVTVAGAEGYLVRWKLETEQGDGGYVQSVAFPSPQDPDRFALIRFGFDAGDKAPDPAEMDAIVAGVEAVAGAGGSGGREV